ncbi:hypothetical protein DNTS_033803 [Danionella cerebrum]|uniref:OBG-type G domain-containing protein n=1 Tax=Danionella cerebrum TaxID=2873325 RepID=A0A553ML68_9TELE|nr:hypothetical protein DNTS_033803 [Danionella translucida]
MGCRWRFPVLGMLRGRGGNVLRLSEASLLLRAFKHREVTAAERPSEKKLVRPERDELRQHEPGVTLLSALVLVPQTRYFVDQRRVKVMAGSGGNGASSFLSEPRKEWGGPDGGDGGAGGDVIIRGQAPQKNLSQQQLKSLSSVSALYRGKDGESGRSKNCFGKNAIPTYIFVPVGTMVREEGELLADLSAHQQQYTVVHGGAGGKGNRFFLSNENRAPVTSTPGEKGQERVIQLELRTMAHASLVGFPNAGKSSLLRAISRARPKVGEYPFTTLNPHVGIVEYRDHLQVAVADIPGLVPGAHLNRGLGLSFLRHIERCRVLLFVLDMSSTRPWEQFHQLHFEIDQYSPQLASRAHIIVANKMDLPGATQNLEALKENLQHTVVPVSALTGDNIGELILHLRKMYDGEPQSSSESS